MHGQACRRWSPRASIADRRLTQACTPGTRAWTAGPAEPVARPPFLGVGGRSSEPSAQSRGGRSETLFFSEFCFLGPCVWYDTPEASDGEEERGFGIEGITAFSQNAIASRSLVRRSPPSLSQSRAEKRFPLQPKMPDARKTRSSCSTFSCTPILATCPASSEVAPVSTVPSVSPHSPAEPTPVSTSVAGFTSASGALPLDSRAPPQRTSSLKRALGRGILWCSQASPPTGALSDHISVQGERRTAPPVSVRGRRTAPVSASAADTSDSCPRYEAGGATPRSVLRAQNS